MLLLEIFAWVGLGLVFGLGRFFFTEEPGHASRIFGGSSVSALIFGAVGRALSPHSVIVEFAPLGLLFAGVGAILFLVAEWVVTHRRPRPH
jgi:hypothetical protein